MKESGSAIDEMALRHLAELKVAIDRAVKERAGSQVILALKAAARAYRRILSGGGKT